MDRAYRSFDTDDFGSVYAMSTGNWLRTLLLICLGGLFTAAAPSLAHAQEFRPFSELEDVCPDCEPTAADVVSLTSGDSVRCDVVAQNEDFMVLERYGEVRSVGRDQVTSVEWADGQRPGDLESSDQILLNNGHVVTGSIVETGETPGHYVVESDVSDVSFVVFKTEAKAVYRDGSRVSEQASE
jgi:hypothetical protein